MECYNTQKGEKDREEGGRQILNEKTIQENMDS